MPRILIPLVGIALALSVSATAQQPLPGPGITLPDVNGFTRGKPTLYKEKGLGYSVPYTQDEVTVIVYVYDQDRARIPAGPDSDAVKAEMLDALAAVEANKANGSYKSINPVAEKVVSIGREKTAHRFRWKQYHVELKSGQAFTEVYLTGYKDHFVKLRVTYLAEKAAARRKAIQPLLEAIGDALE